MHNTREHTKMNKDNENNTTVNISPIESEHLDKYRKLSDSEKENIDRIIEMCLKSKEMK